VKGTEMDERMGTQLREMLITRVQELSNELGIAEEPDALETCTYRPSLGGDHHRDVDQPPRAREKGSDSGLRPTNTGHTAGRLDHLAGSPTVDAYPRHIRDNMHGNSELIKKKSTRCSLQCSSTGKF